MLLGSRNQSLALFGIVAFLSLAKAEPQNWQVKQTAANEVRIETHGPEVLGQTPAAWTLRFLSPSQFRLFEDKSNSAIPEFINVKEDGEYPGVEGLRISTDVIGSVIETGDRETRIGVHVNGQGQLRLRIFAKDLRMAKDVLIDSHKHRVQIGLRKEEAIYGFGDKRAAINQHGHRVEIVNHDAFASETNDSYKSVPFFLSSDHYAFFWHNFRPSIFDVGATDPNQINLIPHVRKGLEGPNDFYFFLGDLKQNLRQYTDLTGHPALLPRWYLGFHQGKASYHGNEGYRVAQEMRRRQLPFDVIYYDDFVPEVTSKHFVDKLRNEQHAHLTLGYGMPLFGEFKGSSDDATILKDLAKENYLMLDHLGQPHIHAATEVEASDQDPNAVAYLDYFNDAAVDFMYERKWRKPVENGVSLGMMDFGELQHIESPEKKFWPSIQATVAETRNLFGLVYPMKILEKIQDKAQTRMTGMVRPGFAGTQRLGWVTTADSTPTFRNFRAHLRAMMNLSLTGFSNSGMDIGGWSEKGPDDVYLRWFEAGTFTSLMWAHGQGDHEPYSHGPRVEAAAREYLNLRYQLIPFLYSQHEVAHRTGIPVVRAMAIEFPDDVLAAPIDDQFMVGDFMMVAPVTNAEGMRSVYLPRGGWFRIDGMLLPHLAGSDSLVMPLSGGQRLDLGSVPLERIPVFVKAGGILPLGPKMQYSTEKPVDSLVVHLFSFAGKGKDVAKSSVLAMYEDDGETPAEKVPWRIRSEYLWRESFGVSEFLIHKRKEGAAPKSDKTLRLVIHGHAKSHSKGPQMVLVNGKKAPEWTWRQGQLQVTVSERDAEAVQIRW